MSRFRVAAITIAGVIVALGLVCGVTNLSWDAVIYAGKDRSWAIYDAVAVSFFALLGSLQATRFMRDLVR